MREAIGFARQRYGWVEPNPAVGCLVIRDGHCIAAGRHEIFGGPHAEVNALVGLPATVIAESTVYVTLEPCGHHGKTPPCVELLLRQPPKRLCIGCTDPNPLMQGRSIERLRQAGIEVDVGIAQSAAQRLIAPFTKFVIQRKSYVIAKWAMSLDGRIATRNGHSQWISGDISRQVVHEIRGRCDAIIVGGRTARIDNPRLTARPAGPRTPLRVVVTRSAGVPLDSHLVQTADEIPVLVTYDPHDSGAAANAERLRKAGVQILPIEHGDDPHVLATALLTALHDRGGTNVLVEGGSQLLGMLFDAQSVDEAHVFIAPRIIGGTAATSPVGGLGVDSVGSAARIIQPQIQQTGDDIYASGSISYLDG